MMKLVFNFNNTRNESFIRRTVFYFERPGFFSLSHETMGTHLNEETGVREENKYVLPFFKDEDSEIHYFPHYYAVPTSSFFCSTREDYLTEREYYLTELSKQGLESVEVDGKTVWKKEKR